MSSFASVGKRHPAVTMEDVTESEYDEVPMEHGASYSLLPSTYFLHDMAGVAPSEPPSSASVQSRSSAVTTEHVPECEQAMEHSAYRYVLVLSSFNILFIWVS